MTGPLHNVTRVTAFKKALITARPMPPDFEFHGVSNCLPSFSITRLIGPVIQGDTHFCAKVPFIEFR